MKNTRRFISAVMALAMVSALAPMGAFASEGDPTKIKLDSTNNTGSMTATYDVSAKYTVTIPAGVALDSENSVTANLEASEVMLESGQKITVKLTGASNTESGATFHAKTTKGDSTATYTIGKETATTGVKVGDVVAEFTENGTKALTFSKAEGATYAGTHTEQLTFNIAVETEDTSPALAGIKEEGAVFELDFTETAGNKFVYKVENKGTSGFVCTSVTQNDNDEIQMFGDFVSATLSGDVFEFKYSLNGYKYDEYSFNINEDSYTFTDVFKTEMTAIKLNDKDVTAKLNKIT